MDDISKMCRFCLQQEQDEDFLINIFNYTSNTNLCQQINTYFGILVNLNDIIPPLICKNCLRSMESFICFIEKIKKSEKILLTLYSPHRQRIPHSDNTEHSSEDKIKHTSKSDKDVANLDDVISCSSSSNLNNCENQIIPRKNYNDSPPVPDITNQDAALYFPGGKRINLFNISDTVKQPSQSNDYSCSICFKVFNTFFEYQDHQSTHDGQLVYCCSRCEQVFTSRQDLVEHESQHKVSCDVCKVEVLPKSLPAHKKKHTDQFKCLQCDTKFASKALLEKHFMARHLGVKGTVCHICGKQNSCQTSMKRHIASHSTDRPFQCPLCTFSSKSKAVLQIHLQRKHKNQKSVCEICAKIFKSQLSLQQHIKRLHTPKKFECRVCRKLFSEKFNLDKHILKKHTQQRLHECRVCKLEFLTVRELKEHMYTHRKGCESCPCCGKVFYYKKMLEKHLIKCVPHLKKNVYDIKGSISMPDTTIYDE